MYMSDIIMIIAFVALAIISVFVFLDLRENNIKYENEQMQCSEITHPELSVENEQRYNHCLSYPETYGIGE